jgi:hypothetical protein
MYDNLQNYGNQEQAIKWAEQLVQQYNDEKYSTHNPRSQVYELVKQFIGQDYELNEEIRKGVEYFFLYHSPGTNAIIFRHRFFELCKKRMNIIIVWKSFRNFETTFSELYGFFGLVCIFVRFYNSGLIIKEHFYNCSRFKIDFYAVIYRQ